MLLHLVIHVSRKSLYGRIRTDQLVYVIYKVSPNTKIQGLSWKAAYGIFREVRFILLQLLFPNNKNLRSNFAFGLLLIRCFYVTFHRPWKENFLGRKMLEAIITISRTRINCDIIFIASKQKKLELYKSFLSVNSFSTKSSHL